jgi:hypothetical protein
MLICGTASAFIAAESRCLANSKIDLDMWIYFGCKSNWFLPNQPTLI